MVADTLRVQMLGEFTLQYGCQEISDNDNRSRKVWLLLAYMIYCRNRSVSQEDLVNLLWGEEERSSNPLNALKTMFHRVRTMLNQLDASAGHTLIIRRDGSYAWNPDVEFFFDVEEFEALCRAGAAAAEEDVRLENYLQALDLYQGDFLTKLSSEPWVVPISAYFHNLYTQTVLETLPLLEAQDRLTTAVSLCRKAVALEPYNETLYRHLMQPLFKLSIGNPGSSFAVEIARKIGLPEDVIADASANVGADYINMDKYLQDIVRDKRYWESKRQNIRQQEKKLEDVTSRYEQDLEAVNKQRKEIIREAKAEAQRILAEANAKIENTVREIKEAQAEKEQTKLARKALEEFKNSVMATEEEDDKIARKMAKLKERNERKKQKQKVTAQPIFNKEVIEVGDNVRLKGQVSAGTVMELQGKQAVVAFGMIKSTVKLEQLEKVSKGQIKREIQKSTFVSSQTTDNMHEKKINFKQEIDVRGMRGDEALQSVTYFIDDAIQVGAGKVRILHGTGTGILRQLIRDYLRTVPGVRRFQDEHVQFGGAGITVVEFD